MKASDWSRFAATSALCAALGFSLAAGAKAETAQTAKAASSSFVFSLPTHAPKGAIVLYSGKAADFQANWLQRYTDKPADWTILKDGTAIPKGYDITTKREFGDFFLHVEFATPLDAKGKLIGEGNSGVGLQGRYEVQIEDNFNKPISPYGCGALYSQIPPIANPSKKPGEWQSFDILFRAPRFDVNGDVNEKPRATVFQNGVLIQNNAEFLGMTGIQYGQYQQMTKTGPIILQGDHNPVHFRNVWIIPLS